MLMVRTSDSSQCRAVAVPWAWKARRMGCEGESLGGSVVLLLLSWLPLCTRGLRVLRVRSCAYSLGDLPSQRIKEIPDHLLTRTCSTLQRIRP